MAKENEILRYDENSEFLSRLEKGRGERVATHLNALAFASARRPNFYGTINLGDFSHDED